MKKYISLFLVLIMSLSMLVGCDNQKEIENEKENDIANIQVENTATPEPEKNQIEGIQIELSDTEVLVDGVVAPNDNTQPVYIANDIVYYEEGHDFTYGEGEKEDEHSKEEADKHLVVHITQAGNYVLSGTLSAGQIAIDLGKESKEDPEAVVNLYLNGVNITNTVAPAVIFYNAYEPFNDVSEETATKDVDTSTAGANVFIVDGTENSINGSYVARIYKPDSVVLSEDGTEVTDEKKLHKYDAAFYSKTTMNVNGGEKNTGVLNIKAENEGLDSEMHLTINGGIINIEAGNDGINTNEDYISVTTVNGGILNILVNGSTGEGDGIDSNGWLVINGGTVVSQACAFSGDAGIDSDMGIHINGGTVIASGNMLDRISESNQTYVVLNFSKFLGAGTYTLKNSDDIVVVEKEIENSFTSLIVSSADLVEGNYTLWYGDNQLVGISTENMMGGMRPNGNMGGFKGEMGTPNEDGTISLSDGTIINPADFEKNRGENGERHEKPDEVEDIMTPPNMGNNQTPPEKPNGEMPEGEMSNSQEPPEMPEGMQGGRPNQELNMETSEVFKIKNGANYFSNIKIIE